MADYFQKGTADFTPVLTKIKSRKPALLALYAIDADFQNTIRQWYGLGGGIPLTGRVLVDQVPKEIMASGKESKIQREELIQLMFGARPGGPKQYPDEQKGAA